MSTEELLQKCADTVTENCDQDELLAFCFQILAGNFETCIVSVQTFNEDGSSNTMSYHAGELEDMLLMAALIFEDCQSAMHEEDGDN